MTIKAIETRYNGYRFRSRLEARWAVFFDALGVKYEYEKEGFDLGDAGYYLPDFWLPDVQCWVEIKPDTPTAGEENKAKALQASSGQECLLIVGAPWPAEYYVYRDDEDDEIPGGVYEFQDCRRCEGIGLEGLSSYGYGGQVSSWICTCDPDKWKGNSGREFSRKVNAAYLAARQARFEHGESPATHHVTPTARPHPTPIANLRDPIETLGEFCIGLLLRYPHACETVKDFLRADDFTSPTTRAVFEAYKRAPEQPLRWQDRDVLSRELGDDLADAAVSAIGSVIEWEAGMEVSDDRLPKIARDAVIRLRRLRINAHMSQLDHAAAEAEDVGDERGLDTIILKKQELLHERRALDTSIMQGR